MGEITDMLNADSLFNSEEMRAAEELAMQDMQGDAPINAPHATVFCRAKKLDAISGKYETFRSSVEYDGTAYFIKIPTSHKHDDTWNLLMEELQINKKLIERNCPHIVRYEKELKRDKDGRPYILGEYIHGETLQDYLDYDAKGKRKPTIGDVSHEVIVNYFRDKTNVRRFIKQFLECLKHMHGLSVVHHDLKPANLLIDCIAGNLYVTDFDLSVGPSSTNKGFGWTEGYVDPEAQELWNNGNADWYDVFGPQFDIYSFGIIINEIFKAYKLRMPPEYEQILNKCTCKRENRYQHVEDIFHDFMDYWMHEGHNSEDFLKMTKTYQAAAKGNAKAKQLLNEFMEFETKL